MSINYIEKGSGLHRAIQAAGHWLQQRNGVWISDSDQAVQTIIDAYDVLPDVKAAAVAAVKATGLAKIQAIYPGIADFYEVQVFADLYLSIVPAARSPVANWSAASAIWTAGANAVAQINAATTVAQVNAVVPAWP